MDKVMLRDDCENVKVVDVAISIFSVLLDVFIDTGAQNVRSGIRL